MDQDATTDTTIRATLELELCAIAPSNGARSVTEDELIRELLEATDWSQPTAVSNALALALTLSATRGLDAAYGRNPERFVRKPPVPPQLPTTAWINKPADTKEAATAH